VKTEVHLEAGIDPTSYKPVYLQIAEILHCQIKSGIYKVGDVLPSEKNLMDEYHISRNTAQKAIEDLVHVGMVKRIQGKGTFVTESIAEFGLLKLSSFTEEMESRGITASSKIITFSKESPTASVAEKLSINQDENVYNLERIRYGDDNPMAYQLSYLPVKFCNGLEQFDFTKESLFSVLENHFHLKISWQNQYLKPRVARKQEALILEIEIGTPLLYLEGVAYLERDIPFEYKQIYYRSDLYDFSLRSTRDNG